MVRRIICSRITKGNALKLILFLIVFYNYVLKEYCYWHDDTYTNFNETQEDSSEKHFIATMKRRLQDMEQACKKETPSYDELAIHNERPYLLFNGKDVAFCPVTKAASTSWKLNLARLFYNSETIQKVLHGTLDQMDPDALILPLATHLNRSTLAELKEYTSCRWNTLVSFLVVRHPFERLVSAFTPSRILLFSHS